MLDVAIIGASGYTGSELLRLLALHPEVRLVGATSEQSAGKTITDLFPGLANFYDKPPVLEALGNPSEESWKTLDALLERTKFFFTALPHGTSTPCVRYLMKNGARVVDLSADFRLKNVGTYETWYGKQHEAADLLPQAVYGLPEFHRKEIVKTKLAATPGCYPTSAIIALAPLLKNHLIDLSSIVVDSKSGASGAGRTPKTDVLFSEVNGGLRAYGFPKHRHTPEIEQELSLIAGKALQITFTPHLVPMNRGILTCAYASLQNAATTEALLETYQNFYHSERYVRVLGAQTLPDTRYVQGSYFCDVTIRVDERNQRVIAVSAIDNLCRGASGMSVACMNLMNGWKEDTALRHVPIFP